MNRSDTIFALATAPGRAGVAVVRVSGPLAELALHRLTRRTQFTPRKAELCLLKSSLGQPIDQALVLWFAAPNSFTGEDVAEFHVHGGRAVLDGVTAALLDLGLKPAEPGAFSRRAVENGKFDLTQAEAIADLVDAETEAQRMQAFRQYDGALGGVYARWREALISARALAEAAIDFADEEIPDTAFDQSRTLVQGILSEMRGHLDDGRCGELVREGVKLAIVGPPNAGKSALINALARRDVAIVSAKAGTTRDVLEIRLDIGGYAFVLSDTAGLRDSEDEIEVQGIARAVKTAASADVILLLQDGAASSSFVCPAELDGKTVIPVWNKADLSWPQTRAGICISAKTGEGLNTLIDALAKHADSVLYRPGVALSRPRHRMAVADAVEALVRAVGTDDLELFAEDVRLASRAIGRIIGVVDVEEILDVVFRDFCIGK